jgi:hypothetical protein
LRPWLASVSQVLKGPSHISVRLRNHGRLPAKVLSHKLLVETHEIKVEILQDKGKEIIDSYPIPPDGDRTHIIKLDENDLTKISGQTWFLGYLFDYSYANNLKGKYGVIVAFRPGEPPFGIMNELME